ncbi:hypothetical protein BC332_30136 [Capsicum chinense]|nr:hypothetical protein BC332_30136 [Capsicum chinense]
MCNEIEKLKINQVKLKFEAMNQITQQCAELCRSEDIKSSITFINLQLQVANALYNSGIAVSSSPSWVYTVANALYNSGIAVSSSPSWVYTVLNVWMFEICSNVDAKVVVKEGNNIPRILNWRVVIVRPQFNQFMTKIFSKCSYANINPTVDEFEKLDLARTSFASDHYGTSSMPSSSKNQDQRSYRVNLSQVTKDHDSFDDFSSTPLQILMRESIYVSRTIDQKFKDLECLMNARFTEVLNSLQQKNETVKQETILKSSRQKCEPSDAVVDDVGPTSTDGVVKETDKSVEMEDDKANQAPSFLKKGEQHEKDVGIEKQSDIVVEEIQQLESIIPGREHN